MARDYEKAWNDLYHFVTTMYTSLRDTPAGDTFDKYQMQAATHAFLVVKEQMEKNSEE